jgi:uncharacterized protein
MSRFEGFVPGRHLIDAYGAGGFRFGDMGHRGSILALPSGVHGWRVARLADLSAEDLAPILAEAAEISHLLLGTGAEIAFVGEPFRGRLRAAGIVLEPMATAAAARTYNILIGEGRKVAAALIAVD